MDLNQTKENELNETNWKASSEQRVLTPFYVYLKNNLAAKQTEYPQMSYLEVVAAL